MNYSPEQLLKFWEKGQPLNEALIRFASSEIKYFPQQYNSDQLTPTNFIAMLKNITDATEYEMKLKTNLFNKIKNGDLIAVGYEPPMKSSDYPIIIPLHVWDNAEINRKKSSIAGNGLNFLSVRIIKKSISEKINKKSNTPKIKLPAPNIVEKLVGRPSQKKDLINTFEWMIKNNRIDKSKSLKAHESELNLALERVNPNSKYIGHLNYKTINRHLGARFNQYKKSQNQSQN